MKKIVVLSSHTPSIFWFRMDMMKTFQNKGYEVYALGNEPEDQWKEMFAKENIVYQQIFVERNGVNPLADLKTFRTIRGKLKKIKPDKIFAYQAKTVIYGGIAANSLGITEFYPLIAGIGSVFLKDDFKTKCIRKILVTEYKLAMRKVPKAFFQNKDDSKIFMDNGIIKEEMISYIPGSGVNLEKFTVQGLPEKFGFLCISRLIKDKGVFEYIKACRIIKQKYPNIRCMLVGPFDSNPSALKPEELQEYIDDGSIKYFGEQSDVRPYIEQCNVFVLPSYREGTPKTNLEAMASGRAVLTTDAPGCKETVKEGINGFMVPVKDINALVEKMEYLINNPDVVEKMAIEGRKMTEKQFDVKIVNNKICESMNI